jgi:hypothetical protein
MFTLLQTEDKQTIANSIEREINFLAGTIFQLWDMYVQMLLEDDEYFK